ncbi:MAG TPA: guanine deaminase [Steroidobacteraceae bacterium]
MSPAAAKISTGERAFLGDVLHAPVRGQIESLTGALMIVGADGRIGALLRQDTPDGVAAATRFRAAGRLTELAAGQYWLPGLVDLHIHAPQWPQLGKALDLPLEQWLHEYTFPLEARCADRRYAEAIYDSLVAALLANGTTTAVYYASIHLPATQSLAATCLRLGQRALVGKVAMDDPSQCPDYYRDNSADSAVADTRAFLKYVHAMPGNASQLIRPVITPRFIPSCTDALLAALGRFASESGCHVQTHCSESDWEHGYVLRRCGRTDTAALAAFGLLTRHTILAHGNFIDDEDVKTIVGRGSGIAHCPLSNVYFSDAVFPLRSMLERGVHVGLGTDIAGGASPSILENTRQAIIASRMLESGVDAALSRSARRRPESHIDASTGFWLATAGGGIALDLPVGIFREGYQFDAIVVDTLMPGSNLHREDGDTPAEMLQKIIYHAARSDLRQVWVAGRQVHAAGPR